ncbi:MAG: glycosyltransferase [Acidimicrobiales bacterium]
MDSVSIGVPVWNGERYLETCVASLLDQTRPPDEIVISDNASTDGTGRIAAGLAAGEPSVRVVHHDVNIGAAGNFNTILDHVEADLFAWCPHDDVWSPGLLDQLAAAHHDTDVAVSYGNARHIDELGEDAGAPVAAIWTDAADPVDRLAELLADPIHSHLHVCNPILGLMRRTLLLETGLIRPFGGSDKVLIVEMAFRGRLAPVQAPFLRRVHASSSVRANPDSESRQRWFDPSAKGPALPESRLLGALWTAVGDAPLDGRQTRRARTLLARWAATGRRPLVVAGEARRWAAWRLATASRRRPFSSGGDGAS